MYIVSDYLQYHTLTINVPLSGTEEKHMQTYKVHMNVFKI